MLRDKLLSEGKATVVVIVAGNYTHAASIRLRLGEMAARHQEPNPNQLVEVISVGTRGHYLPGRDTVELWDHYAKEVSSVELACRRFALGVGR